MRAVVLKKFGGPETVALGDWPAPSVKAGEVEVAVRCAGLNPVDFKIRKKAMWPFMSFKPPLVMGNECAGVVARVGAGVTRFKEGDRVMARVDGLGLGAFAERVCVREAFVARLPDAMGFREGAALPLVGLTAEQALFEVAQLETGQRCFIQAGAGGFGTVAIQLAKRAGAHVSTTASGAGLELTKRLGADEVIDYKSERWPERLKDIDVAIDTLGGQQALDTFKVMKRGGIVVSIGGEPTAQSARDYGVPRIWHPAFWLIGRKCVAAAKASGARYHWYFVRPDGPQLEKLGARVAAGELTVVVDKVFPFAQALEALAYQEAGRAKGKVVLELSA